MNYLLLGVSLLNTLPSADCYIFWLQGLCCILHVDFSSSLFKLYNLGRCAVSSHPVGGVNFTLLHGPVTLWA